MKKIIIYGTGAIGLLLTQYVDIEKAQIVAYVDDFREGVYNDTPIVKTNDLSKVEFDYICVAFGNAEKGFKTLMERGIEKEKIFAYTYSCEMGYNENTFQLKNDEYMRNKFNTFLIPEFFHIPEKRKYLCSMNILEETNIIEKDYVREQTLALIAKEIKRKGLNGNVAELGVFKGEFSKKINFLFSDKTLYLFDTFEGFSSEDILADVELKDENISIFKETSEQLVLEQMPNKSKCIVKKGYFPDTYDLGEEVFCFVSIDVDLYNPIKVGLEVFYKHLEKGGYIMVHDYNNLEYKGAMKAVREYCDAMGISYVPLADVAGSVVITK